MTTFVLKGFSADPLTTLQYRIQGGGLEISPAALAIPKNIPGSIATSLRGLAAPEGAYVEAYLRGPSFPARRLVGAPGEPLLLPPLNMVGDYSLDGIRLVSLEGETLLEGSPSSIPVTIFDEVLISRVTSRPLTLEEIQERGIQIDDNNFRAVEFEVGFVLDGQTIPVKFPVISPNYRDNNELIPASELEERLVQAEKLNREIATTLRLPDELAVTHHGLEITGINFQRVEEKDVELGLAIPPIPALMVIPGNIGFLNQFFSVMIFTENGAPDGSGLSVRNIEAEMVLPPGNDQVKGTYEQPGDDPLRFARIGEAGEIQNILPIINPGPDGLLDTNDDQGRLKPGESGQAEFLVEGLQEGLHVMNLILRAQLDGLAAGSVAIEGKAAGSVLVRNPKFSMAFIHPRTVRTGEPYSAQVTILNTSGTPANLVSVSLNRNSVSGAILESAETVQLGTILPGETATATFQMRAQRTGSITFSNLTTSDDSLTGRFRLRVGVDERGVVLSPDTLLLPEYVDDLPYEIQAAAQRVLGQALSTATAGQVPPGVLRVNRTFLLQKAVELAEAGQRVRYGEGLGSVLPDLLLDWQGARDFSVGWDQIIRETNAGREWREVLALSMELADQGNAVDRLIDRAASFAGRGESWWIAAVSRGDFRWTNAPDNEFTLSVNGLTCGQGISKVPQSAGYAGTAGAWLASTSPGEFTWSFGPGETEPVSLSVVEVRDDGTARILSWNFNNIEPDTCVKVDLLSTDMGARVYPECGTTVSINRDPVASTVTEIPPMVISVRQDPEVLVGRPRERCNIAAATNLDMQQVEFLNYANVVAVLFNKPMSQDTANVPEAYRLENGNEAAFVQVQPGGRVALLTMRAPVGGIVERHLSVDPEVTDVRGNSMVSAPVILESMVIEGITARGRVVRSDGSPAPNVPVTLTYYDEYENRFMGCLPWVKRSAQVMTDDKGNFAFDFILSGIPFSLSASDTSGLSEAAVQVLLGSVGEEDQIRQKLLELSVSPTYAESLLAAFSLGAIPEVIAQIEGIDRALVRDGISDPARYGTESIYALRFRGRGTVTGQVFASDGQSVVPNCAINLYPAVESRELGRGVFADDSGRFAFFGVPLGLFSIQASTGDGLRRSIVETLDTPGQVLDIPVVLSSSKVVNSALQGRVVEVDGGPHAGAQVYVRTYSGTNCGGVVAVAIADSSGYWNADPVPVGTHCVTALSADGRRMGQRIGIQAVEGTINTVNVTLQSRATVTGRVETSTGLPVENALVAGGDVIVRTDELGRFTITGVPTGNSTIEAGLERNPAKGIDFPRLGSAAIDVVAGEENFALIRLNSMARIIGKVLDEEGNPVSGMDVAAPHGGGFYYTTTDGQGNYEFLGLELGSYDVSAPSPSHSEAFDASAAQSSLRTGGDDAMLAVMGEAYAAFSGLNDPYLSGEGASFNPIRWGYASGLKLQFDGQTFVADIQLLGSGTISGTVLNGQGVPIGARVRLTGIGPSESGRPTMIIRGEMNSDPALGTFAFPNQALVGDWGLQAASPFFPVVITKSGRTTALDPDVTGVILQFPPILETNGSISGLVLDPYGNPAGADINVRISFGNDFIIRTDENGRFATQQGTYTLPAGGYSIEAEDLATGAVGRASVNVIAGQDNFVTVQLLGRGNASVLVVSYDGTPIDGAMVQLNGGSYPNVSLEGVTGADGRILFENIFEGIYSANASWVTGTSRIAGRSSLVVPRDGTATTTVRLSATGTIKGTFVSVDGVTPVTYANVSLGSLGFTTSDATGAFEFKDVPLGKYRLTGTDAVSGRTGYADATLSLNNEVLNVLLRETALGMVAGYVLNGYGNELVPNVEVTLSHQDTSISKRIVTTGPDGSFAFPGTPVGKIYLEAKDPLTGNRGNVQATLNEGVARLDLNIQLRQQNIINVQVLHPDGVTPAGGATVTMHISNNSPRTVDTDANGMVRFEQVPLGNVLLSAKSQEVGSTRNWGGAIQSFDVPGAEESMHIVLRGVGQVQGRVLLGDGITPAGGAEVNLKLGNQSVPVPGGLMTPSYSGDIVVMIADSEGRFSFSNVPVDNYTLAAVSQALGVVESGEVTIFGEVVTQDLVLSASGSVTGRIFRADGITPASGAEVLLKFTSVSGLPGRANTTADVSGFFTVDTVPVGPVDLEAFLHEAGAVQYVTTQVSSNGEVVDLGDIYLDEDYPEVVSTEPVHTADAVDIHSSIDILFSEAIDPDSLYESGVFVRPASGGERVPAITQLLAPDGESINRLVQLDPVSPLESETTYQIVVVNGDLKSATNAIINRGPRDLIGRPLTNLFSATFTTRDQRPPELLSLTPGDGTDQVDTSSVVRLSFDEAIQDTATMSLSGPSGGVSGTTSLGLNSLILVFTPDQPLAPNAQYTAQVEGIQDIAGNLAVDQPYTSTFNTLDTIGPTITELRIAGNAPAVAGSQVTLEAILDPVEDGLSIRFLHNFDVLGTTLPDEYTWPIIVPATGVHVYRAIAIDQHGNEGEVAELQVNVIANEPPQINLVRVNPVLGPVETGTYVTVRVEATDDGGISDLRAAMGGAATSGTKVSSGDPIVLQARVNSNAGPADKITIYGSATDTSGVSSGELTWQIDITDGTPPGISVNSPDEGTRFDPGGLLVIGSQATDNFGVSTIHYSVSGAFEVLGTVDLAPTPGQVSPSIQIPIPSDLVSDGSAFSVSLYAMDAAGNESNVVERGYNLVDRIPPVVVSSIPADGEEWVLLRPRIEVRLSKELDPATVQPGVMTLREELSQQVVSGTVGIGSDGATVIFVPDGELSPSAGYCVELSTAIADTFGNHLEAAYTSCFETLQPGIAHPVSGIAVPPSGLSFDGATQYLEVPYVDPVDTGTASTAEVWIRTNQPTSQLLIQNLSGTGIALYIGRFSPGRALFIYDGSSLNESEDFGPDLSDGQWHHLAGVWNNGVVSIYVDGELVGTKDESRITGSNDGYIGSNLGNSDFFNGDMAELRIWNIPRNPDHLLGDMHRRLDGTEAGLVAYYPMGEASGMVAYDHSNYANTALLSGSSVESKPAWITEMPPLYRSELIQAAQQDISSVVLLDGFDPSGGVLDKHITDLPLHGTLFQSPDGILAGESITSTPQSITNSNGWVLYQPDAGFTGRDSFTYVSSNGSSESSPAIVKLNLKAANSLPVAADVDLLGHANIANQFDSILTSVSDAEGDTVYLVQTSEPGNGQLEWQVDGSITYTPDPGYTGTDSFTYRTIDNFHWRRAGNYASGMESGSQTGNPNVDPFGIEVWQYESVHPDDSVGDGEWIQLPGERMVWNETSTSGDNIWSRGANLVPVIAQDSLEQALDDPLDSNCIPLVRWRAPYDHMLIDLIGSISIEWLDNAITEPSPDVEWIVAFRNGESGELTYLQSVVQSQPPDVTTVNRIIELPEISCSSGDELIYGIRGLESRPLSGIRLDDSRLFIVPSGTQQTAQVNLQINPKDPPLIDFADTIEIVQNVASIFTVTASSGAGDLRSLAVNSVSSGISDTIAEFWTATGGLSTVANGPWDTPADYVEPLNQINYSDSGHPVYPGGPYDNFAIRIKGNLVIPESGEYTFYSNSDDGSQVWIDQQLVVNNDGAHGTQERNGTITLASGLHAFETLYFENGGGAVFQVSWEGPGFTKKLIHGTDFSSFTQLYFTESGSREITSAEDVASITGHLIIENPNAGVEELLISAVDSIGLENTLTVQVVVLGDMDSDGIADRDDPDIDGDSISNEDELTAGTDPANPDSDGDGLWDNNDPDPLVPDVGGMPTLEAWWQFNHNLLDMTGSHHANKSYNVGYLTGMVGEGLKLGQSGYVEVPHSSDLANTYFTFEAWVRPDGPGPNEDGYGSQIISKSYSGTFGYGIAWRQDGHFKLGTGSQGNEILSSDSFPAGAFYHVAGTHDGEFFRLYVNGVLQGERASTETVQYNANIPWAIGANPSIYHPSYTRTFNGLIDEVTIFSEALTQQQIQTIYNSGSQGKDVSHWDQDKDGIPDSMDPFPGTPNRNPVALDDEVVVFRNEPTTIPIQDLLQNDGDMDGDQILFIEAGTTTVGNLVYEASYSRLVYTPEGDFTGQTQFEYIIADEWGLPSTAAVVLTARENRRPHASDQETSGGAIAAVRFDGGDIIVRDLDVSESAFGVSLWFRTTNANGGLFSVNGGGSDRHVFLTNGSLRVRLYSNETITSSRNDFNDGEWHHLVYTYGGEVGAQRIYVDGEVVLQGTKTSSDFNWQTDVRFGHSDDGGYWNGDMDETMIFSRAITEPEVQQLADNIVDENDPQLQVWYGFDDYDSSTGLATDKSINGLDVVAGNGDINRRPARIIPGAPVDNFVSSTTQQEVAVTVSLIGFDPDGDSLNAFITVLPSNGKLYQVTGEGLPGSLIDTVPVAVESTTFQLIYLPDPYFNGVDNIFYVVDDGDLVSSPGFVSIMVENLPDAPLVENDTATALQELGGLISGLLANDHDPDGDAITLLDVTQPAHGMLEQLGNDEFAYTPESGFVGQDSFTYRVTDGELASEPATVFVNVQASEIVSWNNPAGGLWNSAANWLPARVPQQTDRVVVNLAGSYSINVNTNVNIANLTIGGEGVAATIHTSGRNLALNHDSQVLDGSSLIIDGDGSITMSKLADLNVEGLLDWQQGDIRNGNGGKVVIANTGSGTITTTNYKYLDGIFEVQGAVTYSGSNFRYGRTTSELAALFNIAETGTLTITGGGGFGHYHSSSNYQFINSGQLIKQGVDTVSSFSQYVKVINSGNIDVQQGALRLNGNNEFGGTTVGNGTVVFNTGTTLITGGNLFAPALTVLDGGTLKLGDMLSPSIPAVEVNSAMLQAVTNYSVGDLSLFSDSARILVDAGKELVVNGTLSYGIGNIYGDGKLVIGESGSGIIGGTSYKYIDGHLENRGLLTYNGANLRFGRQTSGLNASIVNAESGVFTLEGPGTITNYHSSPDYYFENAGVLVRQGPDTTSVFNQYVHFMNTGTLNVSEGTLQLNADGVIGGSLTGNGTVEFNSGNHVMEAAVDSYLANMLFTGGNLEIRDMVNPALPGLEMHNGRATFNGNYSIGNLHLLGDGAYLTVGEGHEVLVTGNMTFSQGNVTGTGKLVVDTAASAEIEGTSYKYLDGNIENRGNLIYSGANLRFGRSSGIVDSRLINAVGGVMEISGQGSFSYYHNSTGYHVENHGLFIKSGFGESLFNANFWNYGTVRLDTAHLKFNRDVTLLPGSELQYVVNTVPGSEQDVARFRVNGALELGGGLTILEGGVVPEANQSLQFLTSSGLTGSFESITGGDFGLVQLVANQIGNNIELLAQPVIIYANSSSRMIKAPSIQIQPDGTWLITIDYDSSSNARLSSNGDAVPVPAFNVQYSYDLNIWKSLSLPVVPFEWEQGSEGILQFHFIPPEDQPVIFMRVKLQDETPASD